MREIISKISVRLVPFLAYLMMRVWFCTCRTRWHNREKFDRLIAGRQPLIATFWHYSIAYTLYNERKNHGTAMVSSSKDGEYIARLSGHFGMDAVRGSSNRHGFNALKKLIKIVRGGDNAIIVADGSQGPPLKVQPGMILLAAKADCPIVPMIWSADRYFSFGSWDRFSLPKPFARVEYFYGDPVYIPKSISSRQLEQHRLELEQTMNHLYQKAWHLQGKTEH